MELENEYVVIIPHTLDRDLIDYEKDF